MPQINSMFELRSSRPQGTASYDDEAGDVPARIHSSSALFTAGCSSGVSRNQAYHATHQSVPITPNTANAVRHPWTAISGKASGVVTEAPNASPRNAVLMARPCSETGNHRDTVRAIIGNAPASQAPNRKRTASRETNPTLAPVSTVNADQQRTIRVRALRVPITSPHQPLGTSKSA